MPQFIQLTKEDCKYLLDLIQEMDSDTTYTQQQRLFTVPKLRRILNDPKSARLAYQDVDYLLELIEDDDLEELSAQKDSTRETILEIQKLQQTRFEIIQDVEKQRESRRLRRLQSQSQAQSQEKQERT